MILGSLEALARGHFPLLARPIYRARQTVLTYNIELSARQLTCVSFQGVDALADYDVPDFCFDITNEEVIKLSPFVLKSKLRISALCQFKLNNSLPN